MSAAAAPASTAAAAPGRPDRRRSPASSSTRSWCSSRSIYLLPLYVMLVNSLKPLDEIQAGNMMALPQAVDARALGQRLVDGADRRRAAPGSGRIFLNSIMMVVPAVAISTVLGALNGYVLTKWRFRGDTLVFGLMLFACFIPFQIGADPDGAILGPARGIAGHSVPGPDLRPRRLRHRLHDALLPQLLRSRSRPSWSARRMIDGAGFFQHLPADHAADLGADRRGLA